MPQQIVDPRAVTEAQIELEGVPYNFTKASPVSWSYEEVKYPDGSAGGRKRSKRVGGKSYENITLEKPRQVPEDNDIIAWASDPCAEPRAVDITWFRSCPDFPLGTYTLVDCQVVNIELGEVDLDGSDISMLTIELSYNDVIIR